MLRKNEKHINLFASLNPFFLRDANSDPENHLNTIKKPQQFFPTCVTLQFLEFQSMDNTPGGHQGKISWLHIYVFRLIYKKKSYIINCI